MPKATTRTSSFSAQIFDRRVAVPGAILALQFVAALYFVGDGFTDIFEKAKLGIDLELAMELFIALALFAGILMEAGYVRHIARELQRKDIALANARGALTDHIALRFEEWKLTPGECDVALFALKGCDVAEIARLRGAAAGTVRSQLSQIYAKAAVSSQAMLASLFIEDLLDGPPVG